MKFEIRGKFMLMVGIGVLIASLDVLLVKVWFEVTVNPVEVCISRHDIHAEEMITEKDIQFISMPESYVRNGILRKKEEIIGRYCAEDALIPAGSLFYKRMIK